jgi:predicted Zn-dependent protease
VLPPAGEKALGDATLEQVRGALADSEFEGIRLCEAPAGVAALNRMRDRIVGDRDLPYDLTITVLDDDLVNAFALPGGHIVFFRGLIDAANDPDEVAAVFAHELGHVVARDPVRIALRSAGSIGVLGLLFGDFAGGAAVLFLTERLIQASYTREAEGAADTFAHGTLIDARVRPDALATFFETLVEEHGESAGIVRHFLSHPDLGDRIAAARAAAEGASVAYEPSLSPADWQALRAICD